MKVGGIPAWSLGLLRTSLAAVYFLSSCSTVPMDVTAMVMLCNKKSERAKFEDNIVPSHLNSSLVFHVDRLLSSQT